MPYATTLTVVHHDDTHTRYHQVHYQLHRDGVRIWTAGGEHLHTDILMTHAEHLRSERAMVPDPGEPFAEPGEPAEDDRDILAAYECPAGGLCGCRHQPSAQGREPRCPRCGCSCPLPDPHETLGDPDACPCCHYSGPA
jgi:hypothetical protein